MYLSPVSDESKYIKSSTSGTSRPVWRMRSVKHGKSARKERERNQSACSVCSDSETESSTIGHGSMDDMCLSVPTPKKWSLPLPMVPRGSESDTSSSWSARSVEETEDERSPIPSPSPSTHSAECSKEDTIDETPKPSQSENSVRVKHKRIKKISKAAETHKLQRMKKTNYGRCKICDAYVYFWGYQCVECELISHKKCLKKMTIMCAKVPLPPKSDIIGLDLTLSNETVPTLVVKCVDEIERRSITRPGIYRMTGAATRVEKILRSFESGPHLIDVSDVNPNDLTSILKEFLRELKYPLITNDVYREFIDIGRVYSAHRSEPLSSEYSDAIVNALKDAVNKLNYNHKATLSFLMYHLRYVTNHHEQNNMNPNSMGIIFAPTLFRPRDSINDLFTEVFEAAPQARVIELMILNVHQIFGPIPNIAQRSSSSSLFNFPETSQ